MECVFIQMTGYHTIQLFSSRLPGTVKLPELQNQCQNLQNKVQTEHYQKQKLERDLQVIQRHITELTDIEKLHQQNFDALTNKIYCLQNEKNKLE